MNTAAQPKSTLFSIVEHNLPELRITVIDRKYWSETSGVEYIQQLAFKQDVEAIKVSVGGNFYATCCIAAVRLSVCRMFDLANVFRSGTQIHRARTICIACLPFSPYQIRGVGRIHDDRPVDNFVYGADTESTECKIKGLLVWPIKTDANANGSTSAQE